MFYDWYPRNWWENIASENDTECTDREIADFLDMSISLRRYPLVIDTASPTDAGIVSYNNIYSYGPPALRVDCSAITDESHTE